jgi:hypothetical protein
MTEPSLFSAEHIELVGMIVIPLGSGILYLIWNQAQNQLKLDLVWEWFTNHGHELTGYKPGDEKRLGGRTPRV